MRRIANVPVQQRLKARADYLSREEIVEAGMIYKTLIRKIKGGELDAVYVGRDLYVTKESFAKAPPVTSYKRGEERRKRGRPKLSKVAMKAPQPSVPAYLGEWEALRAERAALIAEWAAMRAERESAVAFLSHSVRLVEALFKTFQIDVTPAEKSRLFEKIDQA